MKITLAIAMTLLLCLALTGCGDKNAEFKAFTADFEKATNDMIAKINANPTVEGVDEAQILFDGRKADLKTKWSAIKDARGVQVSADVQKGFKTE